MTKRFLRTVALALLWGVPLWGLALTAAKAGDASCCGNAACESKCGNGGCDSCCPHCGCKLCPQCNITCTTKKETVYKYTCKCDAVCIPGVSCVGGCSDCEKGCCDGSCGRCRVREVKRLMKVPCTKEVPVRKCEVVWTCPKCDCSFSGSESSEKPAAAPAEARPAAPAPTMPTAPKAPSPQPPTKQARNVTLLPDMR